MNASLLCCFPQESIHHNTVIWNAKFVFPDVINYSECVNEHEILKKVGKQDLDLGKTAMCRTNKNTE